MRFILTILLGIIFLLQFGCGSEAVNYKIAHLVTINDTTYLKLKGKRVAIHFSGTYEDSTLIPIPKSEGRREGKDIPVQKGYYNYKGYILISKDDLSVNLLIDDTGDKRLRPVTWNGEYSLVR